MNNNESPMETIARLEKEERESPFRKWLSSVLVDEEDDWGYWVYDRILNGCDGEMDAAKFVFYKLTTKKDATHE